MPEIVTAVLDRLETGSPEFADARWRSRAEDEVVLLVEVRRWLGAHDAVSGPEDASGLRGHAAALVARGALPAEVEEFCRTLVGHTFAELWAHAEPADVAGLLHLSRWMPQQEWWGSVLVPAEPGPPQRPWQEEDERSTAARRLLAGQNPVPDAPDTVAIATTGYLVVVTGQATPLPDDEVLSAVQDGRRVVMYPVPTSADRPRVWNTAAAHHTGVRAAATFADSPAGVPSAAAAARRLVDAAAAVDLPLRLVRRRDLVLESTIGGRPEALERLAAALDPLEADPRLLETLVEFFQRDLDRTGTAAALALSRGGLTLRLDRISRLTGLDPRTTRGIQVLRSALSARAMLALPGAGPDPIPAPTAAGSPARRPPARRRVAPAVPNRHVGSAPGATLAGAR